MGNWAQLLPAFSPMRKPGAEPKDIIARRSFHWCYQDSEVSANVPSVLGDSFTQRNVVGLMQQVDFYNNTQH